MPTRSQRRWKPGAELVIATVDPTHYAVRRNPDGTVVAWDIDPDLADELEGDAIVVGTRKPGLRTTAHDFFNGSVAVHLAHRQHRPVIVVPLNPVASGESLPWEEE